jgi:hypothetical protein
MNYFVLGDDGEWDGPLSVETLHDRTATGQLQPNMMIREGDDATPYAAALHPNLAFPAQAPVEDLPPVIAPELRNPPIRDERLRRFSWGAFAFTWLWGLWHGKPGLLLMIPFGWMMRIAGSPPIVVSSILLVIDVWIGTQGNQWAWESERFETLEEMAACQDAWHRAAMWFLGISMLLLCLLFMWISDMALNHSRAMGPPDMIFSQPRR